MIKFIHKTIIVKIHLFFFKVYFLCLKIFQQVLTPIFNVFKGNQICILRAKYYTRLPQFDNLMKYSMMHIIEKHDRLFEAGQIKGKYNL